MRRNCTDTSWKLLYPWQDKSHSSEVDVSCFRFTPHGTSPQFRDGKQLGALIDELKTNPLYAMNRESLVLEVVNYDGACLLSTIAACTVSAWQGCKSARLG